MDWQHLEFLYLILPLCAAWLVLALDSNRRRRKARGAFASQAMWSRILPDESPARFWLKLALRETAIVMGLVALAGPRFGMQYEQVVPRGSDLYVLIDVSRSMLADDVPPSRLGRAKADVSALVNRLEGERVGLIAFAGQAVVKCPLTVDYDSFRRALEELDPDSAPRGGTAIGDAIRKALEVFHAKTDRDQAILLISDGDDQQSYPLEAAAVAAERHVTIFTVGLGDADRGARVPQKSDSKTFLEYQGEQVWSKLDNSLLEQIAVKTSGVYVPAGTRAYDLSELYANYLQGRRGNDTTAQQRIRRSERYQLFLALALAALLLDLCVTPYRRVSPSPRIDLPASQDRVEGRKKPGRKSTTSLIPMAMLTFLITNATTGICLAVEPSAAVRDGLRFYSKDQFDEARQKFAAASEELEKQKSGAAAIAAFDEACAYHRKGDLEKARECYLRAGLSQDLSIATSAHFNLGNLSAEKAKELSGEKPDSVPVDKRQEILDQLTQAVTSYRHCLELKPDHASARRNLELVRQWIKYYTDRWHELDRQKRRDESNLLAFLEFLIQTQTALRETVNQLPSNAHADAFAELKRAQQELREEIPTLRDKIADELRPKPDPNSPSPQGNSQPQANSPEIEEGIALLREWADLAGKGMTEAAERLGAKEQAKATAAQQTALDELDRIWEAIIPFQPLLTKLLKDQTTIARTLAPNPTQNKDSTERTEKTEPPKSDEANQDDSPDAPGTRRDSSPLQIADDDFHSLEQSQSRTLKRTRLLLPKAEAELHRLESAPPPAEANEDKSEDAKGDQASATVDPEQVKSGLRTAIELSPQAVEQMEVATKALRQKDRVAAATHTEQAREILEQIQNAQPKPPAQQNKDQKNDQKDQKQNQDQQQNEQKKEGDDKQDKPEKNDEKKQEDQSNKDKSPPDQKQKQQAQMSQDRMEEALRKVRERQQEKRERDRKLKGQFLGKTPVDKDW